MLFEPNNLATTSSQKWIGNNGCGAPLVTKSWHVPPSFLP